MFELNEEEEEEKRIQMRLERDAKYIERREKELAKEEGIRENQITTAKELIKFGMKIEDISKVTKLTEKEIQDIQAKMKQKSSREK